jgi:hypothetical protein
MLGSDYGACFSDCRYIGDARLRASSFEEAGLTSETTFAPLDSPLQWILGRFTPIYIQSLLVRRTVATELGGLDERLTVGEDTDFFFRMAVRTKLCFVREALVEIDRTPTRPFGLMELFREGSDRMFSSQTLMFRKWLSAGCSDRLVHQQIEAFLRDALYEWTVSSLYRGALRHAIDHVREIRATGAGPLEIARTLSRRTLRKGASAVLGRT